MLLGVPRGLEFLARRKEFGGLSFLPLLYLIWTILPSRARPDTSGLNTNRITAHPEILSHFPLAISFRKGHSYFSYCLHYKHLPHTPPT